MVAFDAPNREVCTVRRMQTNTPLQSLVVMNDPQFVNAARFLALKMKEISGLEKQLEYGFRAATGRKPKVSELKILVQIYNEQKAHYDSKAPDVEKLLLRKGNADEAALVMTASTILNLSETVTRN